MKFKKTLVLVVGLMFLGIAGCSDDEGQIPVGGSPSVAAGICTDVTPIQITTSALTCQAPNCLTAISASGGTGRYLIQVVQEQSPSDPNLTVNNGVVNYSNAIAGTWTLNATITDANCHENQITAPVTLTIAAAAAVAGAGNGSVVAGATTTPATSTECASAPLIRDIAPRNGSCLVNTPCNIQISATPSLPTGRAYTYQLRTTGTGAGVSLPAGLTMSPTGLISGQTAVAGTHNLAIVVDNGCPGMGVRYAFALSTFVAIPSRRQAAVMNLSAQPPPPANHVTNYQMVIRTGFTETNFQFDISTDPNFPPDQTASFFYYNAGDRDGFDKFHLRGDYERRALLQSSDFTDNIPPGASRGSEYTKLQRMPCDGPKYFRFVPRGTQYFNTTNQAWEGAPMPSTWRIWGVRIDLKCSAVDASADSWHTVYSNPEVSFIFEGMQNLVLSTKDVFVRIFTASYVDYINDAETSEDALIDFTFSRNNEWGDTRFWDANGSLASRNLYSALWNFDWNMPTIKGIHPGSDGGRIWAHSYENPTIYTTLYNSDEFIQIPPSFKVTLTRGYMNTDLGVTVFKPGDISKNNTQCYSQSYSVTGLTETGQRNFPAGGYQSIRYLFSCPFPVIPDIFLEPNFPVNWQSIINR